MVALDTHRRKRLRQTKSELIDELEALETRLSDAGGRARGDGIESLKVFFDSVFRDVDDAVVLADAEHRVVTCNPAFSRAFGYLPADVAGRSMETLYAGRGRCEQQYHMPFAAAEARPLEPAEVTYVRRNGQSFAGETIEAPVRDDGGGPRGYLVIIREITERMAADREAARFRRAIDNLAEGLAFFDAEDRLIFCNDEYRRIHPAIQDLLVPGVRFENLVRAHAERGVIPEARGREQDYVRDRMERHRNPGAPVIRELSDGIWFIIREGRTPDGGTYAITTDITQLKGAENALLRNQKQFTDAIAALQEAFALYDAEDRLVVCNEEYRRLHPKVLHILKPGMRFEDLVRENIRKGMNADAIGNEEVHIRERMERHRNPQGTIIRHLTDGTVFLIQESRTPDGGVVVTETDITERRRAEAALRTSEDRLRGAIESLQEGFALFDADDRLVALNDEYQRVNPAAQEIMEHGGTYEDVLRANVARGMLIEAIGREEEFVKERLARHRKPKGPILRRMADGNWYMIKEVKTPEGGTAVTFINITDLFQAEEALKQSEQRFKDFAEVASDWFWEMDEDLRFTYFSGRNFEVTGYKDSAIIGKTRLEVTSEDTSAEHWQRHLADLKARRPFKDFCYDLPTPDGKTLRISVSGMPIFDTKGIFKGYRGTGADITERWHAEQALRESEARFRAVVDNLPSALLLKDVSGRYLLANKQFNTYFNPDGKDVTGKTSYDFLPKKFADQFTRHDREVVESGTAIMRELDMPFADGNVHTIILHKFPIFDANGRCVAIGGITTDITERKQAEEALKKSEARFRAVVDNSPAAIVLKDLNGRYLVANRQWHNWCNPGGQDIAGKTAKDVFPRDFADEIADHERRVKDSGSSSLREFETEFPDGVRRAAMTAKFPLVGPDGKSFAIGAIITDITERKQAEQRLRDSEWRFRNLIEGSIQGILISAESGKPLFGNQALLDIFGFDSFTEFFEQENQSVIFAPYEVNRLEELFAARFKDEGVARDYEFDGIRRDGSIVRLQASSRVLTWRGVPAIQTTIIDVTERSRAQKARERLSLAIENVPVGIALFDRDDRLVFCNSRYRELMVIMADKLKPGTTFEEMLRTIVARAPVKAARGREEDYIRERLERHRNPKGPVDLRRDDKWLRANETRMPDDSIFVIITDITERKLAEEALVAGEKRLRGAIESMQEGFALFDADDRLVAINDVFRHISLEAQAFLEKGARFEDIIRANLKKGRIVEAIGREEEFIRERMAQHRNPTGPIIRQFNDGNWYILKETRTPDGGTALTFTDISELKRAEAALMESEARFRDVAESAGDWFWDMGPDLRFTFLSQRFYELFPVTSNQIIGKTRDEFAGAARGDERWRQHLDEIAHHKPFRDFEYQVSLPDGRVKTIRISGKPLFDAAGTFKGYRGTGTDVTAEKEAEAAAARAQANLYDAVESIDAGFALFDRDDRLVLCNTRYRKLDPRLDDLTRPGMLFEDIVRGVAKAGLYHASMGTPEEIVAERMQFHRNAPSSHEQQYADGRWLAVDEYKTHDGGTALLWTDITERRMLERQLAGAQRMEALGKLTGGVAHDFNNLLTIVLGNLQLMEPRVGDDVKLKKYVQMSTGAAQRGAELTGRLLAFARRQMLETAPTDINKLVFGMGALLRGILGETIKVENVLAEDLRQIRTDATQLENALINLAINARDAMSEGGLLTIETANVTLDRTYVLQNPGALAGDFVMIAVSDTGHGMTAEVAEHAFEPFFTTKEIGKGTGLGLSMVYGFVKQLGGYIKIYSEPGEGTVIKMYLPQAKGDDALAAAPDAAEAAVGGPETILVVEDDPEVRQTTVALLEELSYQVIEAPNGPSALKLLDRQPDIDLLLTDVIMPGGMRGPDLAREVHKRRPNMKILYMSGYTEHTVLRDGMAEADVQLLSKPFQKNELANKVRNVLDN
ncbi:MAG TPA: PAS-domain containing protein [Rhodospirillales bacterium]